MFTNKKRAGLNTSPLFIYTTKANPQTVVQTTLFCTFTSVFTFFRQENNFSIDFFDTFMRTKP